MRILRSRTDTKQIKQFLLASLLTCGLAVSSWAQTLQHRYSFNESPGSTTISDSVGSANGTFYSGGAGGDFDGASLIFSGYEDYADLGPNVITGLTGFTIETWASFDNPLGNSVEYERLFDFGQSDDTTGRETNGISFSPYSSGGAVRLEVYDATGAAVALNAYPSLINQGQVHVVTVYDPQTPLMAIYVNGVLKASRNDVTIPCSNFTTPRSWLGRSGFASDPRLTGAINEMRIYSGVRSPMQIAVGAAAGPDQILDDPGALTGIHMSVAAPVYAGSSSVQVTVTGDYASVVGVNLSFANVALASGNTNVLKVSTNGLSFDAVGTGTTTLVASFGGFSATQTVTVVDMPAVLKHQYHFKDTAGSSTFADSAGTASGSLIGNASLDGNRLILPGGTSQSAYAALPPHIIDGYTSLTFEFWVKFGTNNDWGRLLDFGWTNPNNNSGHNCIDFTPRAGGGGAVNFEVADSTHAEQLMPSPRLDGANVHLVLVYNPLGHQMCVYTNGLLMGLKTDTTIPMSAINSDHCWLGQSSWLNDPEGVATIDEFRIYDGVLSPFRVALNSAGGPDSYIADPGTLNAIQAVVPDSIYVDEPFTVTVLGDYQNVSNLNLSFAKPTVQVGDTNILKVSGLQVRPYAPGTTPLTVSYGGFTVTNTVTVIDQAPWTLIHRYSFDGPAAASPATFADSIGGADGTLVGTATVNGNGKLVLTGNNNGNNNYAALPAHLLDTNVAFSFEAWVTFGTNPTWARFLGFGDTVNGGGNSYMDFIPNDGFHGDARWETGAFSVDPVAPNLSGQTVHLILVYNNDPARHTMSVYTNGVLAAVNASIAPYTFNMTHCWLGKSSYGGDQNGVFTLDEFRIYNGPLTARQAMANDIAGASNPPTTHRPALGIALSGNSVVFSWTDGAYNLQSCTSLDGTKTWTGVGTTPVVVNGTNQVTLPITSSPAFFRLVK